MMEGTPIKTAASCPIAVSIAQFIICSLIEPTGRDATSEVHASANAYFFSAVAGAETAKSEFHISAAHFQFPSACFSQTSRYLPRSLIGLSPTSFMVSSYAPLTHAIAPLWPSFTLDGLQLITSPGAARRSFHRFRTVSFVAALVAFGGSTMASSE